MIRTKTQDYDEQYNHVSEHATLHANIIGSYDGQKVNALIIGQRFQIFVQSWNEHILLLH